MNKNKYLIIIILITTCVFLLGINSWPIADDFCNKNRVDLLGIKNSTIETYNNWSGRILTTFFVNIVFKYINIPNIYYVSGLLGIIFALLIITTTSLFFKDNQNILKNSVFVFAVFWIGLRSLIGETVFWVTGGIVYLIPLFISTIWIKYILKIVFISKVRKTNYFKILILLITSFFIGNSIEPLSIAAIVFLLTTIIIYYKKINKLTKIELFLILVSTIIGSAVLFLSKGNFRRLESDSILTFNTDINMLIKNYFVILYEYLKRGKILYTVILLVIPFVLPKKNT